MKKNSQSVLIGGLIGLTAFISNVNGCIDFLKRLNVDLSNHDKMKDTIFLLKDIASLILPLVIGYFVYLLLKTIKKQEEDDTLIVKTIITLREEIIGLKIFNQCLIEEVTKNTILIPGNKNSIVDSKMQQDAIRNKAMEKMNQVFKHTKTDAEKEALLNIVLNIAIEKKL